MPPPLENPHLNFLCKLKGTEKSEGNLLSFIPSIYIPGTSIPSTIWINKYEGGGLISVSLKTQRGVQTPTPLTPLPAVNTWNIQISKPLRFKDRLVSLYWYLFARSNTSVSTLIHVHSTFLHEFIHLQIHS